MTLLQSDDYRITVDGYGAAQSFPYTLELGIEGKPHPVAPEGLTGTWRLLVDRDNSIEVREVPGGKLRLAVHALWKGAKRKEYGPNIGEISGTVDLLDGKAVFEHPENECVLTLNFSGEKLNVGQEGTCRFGMNVTVGGGAYQYSKTKQGYEQAYSACMQGHGYSVGR